MVSTFPIPTIVFLFFSFSTFLILKDFSTSLSTPRTFPLFYFPSLQFTCLLSELFHFSTSKFQRISFTCLLSYFSNSHNCFSTFILFYFSNSQGLSYFSKQPTDLSTFQLFQFTIYVSTFRAFPLFYISKDPVYFLILQLSRTFLLF